ncbi:MAG: hypothetical protein ACOYXS_04690 [Chloroflexota bacterium]
MSDPGFVLAAYTIVLGVLGGYVVALGRRDRSARRLLDAVARQRATRPEDQAKDAEANEAEERGLER